VDKLITTAHERFWNPEAFARDSWIQEQAASLPPGSQVLDAGAGASKYRPCFSHCQYQTQDFCQYEGGLVKYTQPIDHVCEITAIPLPEQSLDAIVCTEVFEHVVDPVAVLVEFHRLLRPGGKLLLTAPFLSHMHMEPYHFYGGFTHFWYRYWLPAKGFKVDTITAVGGPGQACVNAGRTLYFEWAAAEKRASFFPRICSRGLRALAWPVIHYLIPGILPRMDPVLGSRVVCSGHLVAATRLP
jgi:SAM-dependent methyltransferase